MSDATAVSLFQSIARQPPIVTRIQYFQDWNDFLRFRRLCKKWYTWGCLNDQKWAQYLRKHGPRMIVPHSVHRNGYCSNATECKSIYHYRSETLGLRLSATIPLFRQAYRVTARKRRRQLKSTIRYLRKQEIRTRQKITELHEDLRVYAEDYEEAKEEYEELKFPLNLPYAPIRRKRRRIDFNQCGLDM